MRRFPARDLEGVTSNKDPSPPCQSTSHRYEEFVGARKEHFLSAMIIFWVSPVALLGGAGEIFPKPLNLH